MPTIFEIAGSIEIEGVPVSRPHQTECEFCGEHTETRPLGPCGEELCTECVERTEAFDLNLDEPWMEFDDFIDDLSR